ncbi:MAG: hypothetical protein ACYCY9_10830 [Thiobacillus sp.]
MKLSPQQQHIGRQMIEAAQQLEQAKRIGNVGGPLALAISASSQSTARRKLADLVRLSAKHAPRIAIAKDEAPSGDWSTIEAFGISQQKLPAILEELGASDFDIKRAMIDPAAAYALLIELAKLRRAA